MNWKSDEPSQEADQTEETNDIGGRPKSDKPKAKSVGGKRQGQNG